MKGPERYIASRKIWVRRAAPEIQEATLTVRGVVYTLLENHIRISLKESQAGTVLFYHMYDYLQGGERAWGRWYKNGLAREELPTAETPIFQTEIPGYEVENNPLDTTTAVVSITFTPKGLRQIEKIVGGGQG